jgi:hypothetical protein
VAGEEAGPPGPRGFRLRHVQYRGEGGERVSVLATPPHGNGTVPPFYRPRGGSLQACRTVLTTCGGMAHSIVE